MNIVFLTGSHPRHAYMARAIASTGALAGLVVEQRENFMPATPVDLPSDTSSFFQHHLAGRNKAELQHFGSVRWPDVPRLDVSISTLNSESTVDFVNALQPTLFLSYGIHKLTPKSLESIACGLKWNIHGGLSPWYRGVITHFWPSYLLEPQMTGMTVHELTQDIDGGDLIHQSIAPLVRGDGIHDLACRAVMSLGQEMPTLVNVITDGHLKSPVKQSTTGRIWRSKDWQPAHLHLVYEQHGNRMVDKYLDGAFEGNLPKLVRQTDLD
jgi:folate-dependent phosphoribosylglycinamide formyltransferase PurN